MSNPLVPLGHVAFISTGMVVGGSAKHDPLGSHQALMPRHLEDGDDYIYQPDHANLIIPRRNPDRYLLRRGDVVIVARGVHNRAVRIESVPGNMIATSVFYILRCGDEVDSHFLRYCLNQEMILGKIGQIRSAAGTPIVSRKELEQLTIPLPPLAEQLRVAQIDALMMKEQRLQRRMTTLIEMRRKIVGRSLFERLSPNDQ